MKAAIREKYGPPNRITICDNVVPEPKNDEILVKVMATTVNRTDCANLQAKPFIMRFILGLFKPKKAVLGTDFAGTVAAVGSKVSSFTLGDAVFGFKDTGLQSQAEYLIVNVKDAYLIPKNIDFYQGAASLEGAHYAYSFIHKVKINEGQKILLNGASGAIGSALLQLLKPFNVQVYATSHPNALEIIKKLGTVKVYNYTNEDFSADPIKYDHIFDAVGKSTFGKCKHLLNKNGTYTSSELGPYNQNLFYSIFTIFSRKKVIFPVPYHTSKTIPYIIEMIQNGTFTPIIDKSYDLNEVIKAYEYVLTGQKIGNVILKIQ